MMRQGLDDLVVADDDAVATSGADAADAAACAVVADAFSFAYVGSDEPVLRDVTLRIGAGDFALVCGRTGSGKTTLLRCMSAALAPCGRASGVLKVWGKCEPDALDAGYVFQDPDSQIVCDTVWRELAFGLENVGMPPEAMRRRVAEVATVFGIGDWFDAKTSELSGGQKQVLNIASVVAMQPRLLLLDEPTAQLDPVAARRLVDVLRMVNRELGLTVVVATHSPETFSGVATAAFELSDGAVVSRAVAELAECGAPVNFAWCEDRPVRQPDATLSHDAPVCAKDAWFSYERGGRWVVRDLDLDVREGEVVSLVGGNGCGKTTLLKLVGQVLKPQRGRVGNRLADSQAYLPQDPRLLFLYDTVQEEADAAGLDLAALGLSPREAALSPLDLSGGQQQMLALGKLLAANPRLLLLDEPAKGLDAALQLEVGLLIRNAAACGATVVMATHDLSFAACVSDRIALLFDGQIASFEGPCAFCEGNIYYRPRANAFTRAWEEACSSGLPKVPACGMPFEQARGLA